MWYWHELHEWNIQVFFRLYKNDIFEMLYSNTIIPPSKNLYFRNVLFFFFGKAWDLKWPKMVFGSRYSKRWRKQTMAKIQFYFFYSVSKFSGGSSNTLSRNPIFSKIRIPQCFEVLTILSSISMPIGSRIH